MAGLEPEPEELAHPLELGLRLPDEILIAELVVALGDPAAELPRTLDLEPPLAGEGRETPWAGQIEARPAAHRDQRKRRVAAVAHEVDVLRLGEDALEQVELLHVRRGLVPVPGLAPTIRIGLVDGADALGGGRARGQALPHLLRRHSPFTHASEPPEVVEKGVECRSSGGGEPRAAG